MVAAQLQRRAAPATPLRNGRLSIMSRTRQCSVVPHYRGDAGERQRSARTSPISPAAGRIAAGALPMSEGNLYGWVADPQSIKPGNKMPTIGLEPDELHAVVAYLETLK